MSERESHKERYTADGLEVADRHRQQNGLLPIVPQYANHTAQEDYAHDYIGRSNPGSEDRPLAQQRRNPWGLGPVAFGFLVAVLTAVVVGAVVGGGVGSQINKDSRYVKK